MSARGKSERTVHVRKGQMVTVRMRKGVELTITHYASGAVDVRNASSRRLSLSWGPKESDA